MSGMRQFALEVENFLVNFVLMFIVWTAGFFLYINVVDEISKDAAVPFNMTFAVFFFLCLLIQNVFFRSLFYFISGHKIESKDNGKIGVLAHNFMFNIIILGTMVVEVFKLDYGIKMIAMGLLLLEFVPCVIKKYSKSLSCCIFKIETVKISKFNADATAAFADNEKEN